MGLYLKTLLLLFGFSLAQASGCKDIDLRDKSQSCRVSTAIAQLGTSKLRRALDPVLRDLPGSMRIEEIYSTRFETAVEFQDFLDQKFQGIKQLLSEMSLFAETKARKEMYEIFMLRIDEQKSRYLKIRNELEEKSEVAFKDISFPEIAFAKKYRPFNFAVKSWMLAMSGIYGEILASTYLTKIAGMEMHIRNLVSEKEAQVLEENNLLKPFVNYEMDLITEEGKNWYEVKYLTRGFGGGSKWEGDLSRKLRKIDQGLALLKKELGSVYHFELIVFGPGRMRNEFVEEIKTLRHVNLRIVKYKSSKRNRAWNR